MGGKKEGEVPAWLELSLSPCPFASPDWMDCCDGKDCQHYVNEREG